MLIGVGLGPGDPELLTLKAVRLLKEAEKIYVPGEIAGRLVREYRECEVLEFPMCDDEAGIRACIESHAEKIAIEAESGLVVFGILGDPNVYSTFARLCEIMKEKYPNIRCSTEPGVSAVTAFASVANIPLCNGFIVSDGSAPFERVIMKVRNPKETAESLKMQGYDRFILVERMFMERMKVYNDDELPEKSDYMSILYAGKRYA